MADSSATWITIVTFFVSSFKNVDCIKNVIIFYNHESKLYLYKDIFNWYELFSLAKQLFYLLLRKMINALADIVA